MDITWEGHMQINAPIEQVYRYLADFPRHCEWAQTVERLELVRPGDSAGIGAQYLTTERQTMQADRKPRAPLTEGEPDQTFCEVRELTPNQRIAWRAHLLPDAEPSADLDFELGLAKDGGTLLTQHQRILVPDPMLSELQGMFGSDVVEKVYAQWEAGLRNIKAILEEERGSAPTAPDAP
jgi:uncharacterized protein YndB with AHSA1/START domain